MLSFAGPQHGRIIHSHFDGTGLTLQCSRLFDFRQKETAPLSLFFRYTLSSVVDVQARKEGHSTPGD